MSAEESGDTPAAGSQGPAPQRRKRQQLAAVSLWSVSKPFDGACLSFLSLSNVMIPLLSIHRAVLKTTWK